jgi:RNA polymerase sigma-70 factor (ECF subfamily)
VDRPTPPSLAEAQTFHDLIDLYRRHERRIFRLCRSYLMNPADAEDATQETFMRAAGRLGSLSGDPAAYLTVIARNVCCNEIRRRKSGGTAALKQPPDPSFEVDGTVADRAGIEAVWGALSTSERELLSHSFAGFSYNEISELTGRSVKSVSVGLTRARHKARQLAGSLSSVILIPAGLWRGRRHLLRRMSSSNPDVAAVGQVAAQQAAIASPILATLVAATLSAAPAILPWHSSPSLVATTGAADTRHRAGTPVPDPSIARGASSDPTAPSHPGSGSSSPGSPSGVAPPPDTSPTVQSSGYVANGTVAPGQSATPEDANFASLTPSPNYASDHTVYASGTLVNGCMRPTCPVLFRSADAGGSWQRVPASGLAGGPVLLPPTYPVDQTIFVSSPAGLQRSDDGGNTFRLVVPVAGPMAMAPDSTAGAGRVTIAAQVLVVYNANTGQVTPGPSLPPGVGRPDDIAFAGPNTLLVTAEVADPQASGQQDSLILRCDGGNACQPIFAAPGALQWKLVVSPTYPVDHTVFAFSDSHIAVSHDGAGTFTILASAPAGNVNTLALAPDFSQSRHLTLGAVIAAPSGQQRQSLARSNDGGNTFTEISTTGLPAPLSLHALVHLPGGRMLAAFNGSQAFGIRCSPDGGLTWRQTC